MIDADLLMVAKMPLVDLSILGVFCGTIILDPPPMDPPRLGKLTDDFAIEDEEREDRMLFDLETFGVLAALTVVY